MVAAARGLAGDTEVALPKAGAIFSFPGGWRRGMRTEPEKDLGLLTPDAAGHRLGRGQAGMFSLVPLSAQHTRKQGADVKILRIPENSEGGKKIPHFPPYNFPGIHIFKYTNHDFFQQKNKTCIMHHIFLKYPDDFTPVKDAEKNCMA